MRSIRQIDYKKLNSEVELISTASSPSSAWRNAMFPFLYESAEGGFHDSFDMRFSRLYKLSGALFESRTEVNGQPMFVWGDVDTWVNTWWQTKKEASRYVSFIERVFLQRHGGYFADVDKETMRVKIEQLRKTAKVNKYGHATVANTIRALCTIYSFTNVDAIIKRAMTLINAERKPLYLYVARDYIENHYDNLKRAENLSSCMTKGTESLDAINHYVHVDKASANAQGYKTKLVGDKPSIFVPNIATLNNTEGVALGLTSHYSPDELKELDHYGFNGRCVLIKKDDKWAFTRFYGNEGAKGTVHNMIEWTSTFKGTRLKGYVSANEQQGGQWENLTRYLLPYVDGEDNLFKRVGVVQRDEIGRPYYWFEVVEGNRRMSTVPDCNKGNFFYLDQSDWYVIPFRYTTKCAITGEEINQYTGWNVADGVHVHNNLLAKFETVRDMMGGDTDKAIDFLKQLIVPMRSDLVQQVEKWRTRVDTIQEQLHRLERESSEIQSQVSLYRRLTGCVELACEDWYFDYVDGDARSRIQALENWIKRTITNDKQVWRSYGYTFAMIWNGVRKAIKTAPGEPMIKVLLNMTIAKTHAIFEDREVFQRDSEFEYIKRLVVDFRDTFDREVRNITPPPRTQEEREQAKQADAPSSKLSVDSSTGGITIPIGDVTDAPCDRARALQISEAMLQEILRTWSNRETSDY